MRLSPDALLTFLAVAKAGSLTEAATVLHKTQPALSAQLKGLNDLFGEPLYERHAKGIRLTETGERLLPYTLELSRSLEGALSLAQDYREGRRGRIRIAASMTVAVYVLPKRLASFHARYPAIELHLLTHNSEEAERLLSMNDADIAFVEAPAETHGFETQVIAYDELVLVVRPDHPLAARGSVRLSDLQGLGVVQREKGSGTRAVVDEALEPHHIEPHTTLIATTIEAVKEAVLQGFGAGFLSRVAIEREVQAGLLVPLEIHGLTLRRPFTMLYRKLEGSSYALRALVEHIQQEDSAKPSDI